jgi:hypothetical protein
VRAGFLGLSRKAAIEILKAGSITQFREYLLLTDTQAKRALGEVRRLITIGTLFDDRLALIWCWGHSGLDTMFGSSLQTPEQPCRVGRGAVAAQARKPLTINPTASSLSPSPGRLGDRNAQSAPPHETLCRL